ncbi:lipid kinase [Nonomuraea sp. WAC 01424]|uniref:diacylglycerol/lipid kinase family protein n=1 Tax=Nonomuraea sp. WAC 01424 TaxID=2203200 RepID=UPI000F7AEEF2|nr:diacylglycerol kinase family protein [Nonomuraea sp. WAC 01424]RSN05823.1 lipid kinase [Nonomuraea sp. WAC 01424]
MRLLVICNPRAGRAGDDSTREVLRLLRAEADVQVCHTGTEAARSSGDDRVPVVLGGDGSVHALVAALLERGRLNAAPIGLIPMGTGNDLARTLGLPLDPAEAVRVVLAGHERAMDLLIDDDGGVVVNAVHLGVGARAAERAAPLKPLLHRAAYAVGAALAGTGTGGWRLRVRVDGAQVCTGRRRVLMAGVGNGATIGGGTPLTPAARPDDGLAEVVVSYATGPLARLAFAAGLRRGRHPARPDVRTFRGRRITIAGGPVPASVDGELEQVAQGRTWIVRPAAWRVLAPAAS